MSSELDTGPNRVVRVSDPAAPGELYSWGLCQGAVELSSDWRGHPHECDEMKGVVPIYNQGSCRRGPFSFLLRDR